jgi:hypothetical protein
VGNAELGANQPKQLVFKFDVSGGTTPGAAGAVALSNKAGTGAQTIPDNALITRAYVEAIVTTVEDSGTPTIKLGITGDDDCFIGATARTHATYTAGNLTELTAGIPIKTTAAVSLLATIESADLNAGTFFVWVEYYEGA